MNKSKLKYSAPKEYCNYEEFYYDELYGNKECIWRGVRTPSHEGIDELWGGVNKDFS
jgi:hypothetical protein